MSQTIQKKRILFLITKSNWGGAQRYVFDLATNLDRAQYDISVAVGGSGELAQKLKDAGVTLYPIKSLQRDVSLTQELRAFSEITKLILHTKPDVLHINSSKAGFLGAFIGRLLGVRRVLFTAHGWAFNEDRPTLQKLMITYLHWLTVFFSHATIAVSQMIKDQLPGPFTNQKMVVIHNGRTAVSHFDREDARNKITSLAPALSEYKADTWTVTIGELHPVKQHEQMIAVTAELIKQGHTIRHVIIGTGDQLDTLSSLIEKAGLTEHVFLIGHIDEAARFLTAFDIYIQPSLSEALGYTVIEAAQAGLPIVASRVGGIPEIITDQQTGLLVPPSDTTAFTSAISSLLDNTIQATKYGQAAQADAQSFSLQTMVERTTKLY